VQVQLGEDASSSQLFQSSWDQGKRITVLDCLVIKSSVVDARPKTLSFVTTKKKLEVAGDVDGWMWM